MRPPKPGALFFNFLQGGADVFAGNLCVIFQSVPAKQFALFRRRRGDDRSQRRFVGGGELQFLMRKTKCEADSGRVAGRIVETRRGLKPESSFASSKVLAHQPAPRRRANGG